MELIFVYIWNLELIIGRVLGRGALSYVFRGRVGILRTAVAIKRLNKEDKESPKAFCRELMIASSLQHPNIVPLLGFCIDPEEGLFLVYKYVSSGSLERHLHGIASFLSLEFHVDCVKLVLEYITWPSTISLSFLVELVF